MKKQGTSPFKKVKCGIWLKEEGRFMTIKEWNKNVKIGWFIKDNKLQQTMDILTNKVREVNEAEIKSFQ